MTATDTHLARLSSAERYHELIVAGAIPFHSLCMHHLLPFHGVAREGCLPGLRGVQKLGARTVTSALRGPVRDDPRTRQDFLALATQTSS
jgi:GTP cyclohydrolase I